HHVHLYRPADLSVRRFVLRRRRSSSIGRWKGVHRVRHLRAALLGSDKARAHGEFDETHCAVLTVAFTGRPLSCDLTRSKTRDAGLPSFLPSARATPVSAGTGSRELRPRPGSDRSESYTCTLT